ncbi:ABC-type metal ion transport system, periplasmic component (plasmid) [Peptoclostridium acidaminophilum DSM 3953]|uniref:Lipoprotein n=1 Tax=Peptoclostridium acidaminophilum DSM 3953 TaxID=1286171 RepID=W8TI75_PEPAC|nr:MetQ/NlpA family ABC transporter substrate-binding protein [Peptoclostridium acidaminophilum]AHM57548.1 ABC-type metal ion transport system, periplasmic component [Peptoclostridium acidaminophilum DSM 3953]
MNKVLKLATALLLTGALLVGCSPKQEADKSALADSAETKTIVVGATPLPHSELLEFIKPQLEKEGITLEITEFTDYNTPNLALADGALDANFFQHVPYMEEFAAKNNLEIVSAGKVHVEPMGVYSKKIASADEIANGAKVAVPNDPTNEGRALLLLQSNGLIKLKDAAALDQTPKDIVENPKNLEFTELEAAQLPRVLDDVDFAVINTNYALEGGLNPVKDALFAEGEDSPYANIVTVRKGDEKRPEIVKLIEVLNSPEVKQFIEEKYEGSIIPAF